MSRRRRSTDQAIAEAVQSSQSIRQVLTKLGLSPTGANYDGIQRHFKRLGLDTSHFRGQGWNKGGTSRPWARSLPLEEILVENSTYIWRNKLKARLLREGLLANVCSRCGLEPIWLGEPLVMILDHKNGNRTDHRLDNLRLLCPNCNTQQPTFAGRNNKGRNRPS